MPLSSDAVAVAAILVMCKDRLQHLRIALPTWTNQQTNVNYSVTILDYGCPANTAAQVRELHLPHVRTVTTSPPTPFYNHAHSHNLAARTTRAPILVFVDADNLLKPTWLTSAIAPILIGDADYCESLWDPRCKNPGTCAIRKRLHDKIRGFDETFTGWGQADKDYCLRASAHGQKAQWDTTLLDTIPHDEETRVKHSPFPTTAESNRNNTARLGNWSRTVNPTAYGAGIFQIHDPDPYPIGQE
jgi:hypothetical protein